MKARQALDIGGKEESSDRGAGRAEGPIKMQVKKLMCSFT